MNKKLIFIHLSFFICITNTLNAEYTISGIVQNQNGDIIKKGSIILVNETDGEEVKKTKLNRKGKFKLKKIDSGKYIINVDATSKQSKPAVSYTHLTLPTKRIV